MMGDKCEWKDGKFEACGEFNKYSDFCFSGKFVYIYRNKAEYIIDFCPFCGADIRKSEPAEPLIVKSGETWVAHWEGVDYLCVDPNYYSPITIRPDLFAEILNDHPDHWKSFTGPNRDITELIDEIAKLRPMVMVRNHINNSLTTGKLIYIESESTLDDPYRYHTVSGPWTNCRLATAHELQESK